MRKIIIAGAFVLTLFTVISSFTRPPDKSKDYLQTQGKWADSLLASMTLDEKVGQLFMMATYSNRTEKYYQQVENNIATYHIGGLIFFQGGPHRQARLTNRYQQLSRVPLMIGIDAEWGLGMRLDSVIDFPKQITLGAIQDNAYIERFGQEVGRQCQRLGIHINFAPSIDVNTNPDNPVINYRSFGESQINVAEKGLAYVRGMKRYHVMGSAKHFPGHGDTDQDSHHTLPVVTHSMKRLNEVELYPFRRLIADSIGTVMTGHLLVPALEARGNTPTSISERIVTEIIKNQMGFRGLTVTDALNMRGITQGLQPGEPEFLAFMAGNDILLQTGNLPAAFNRIKKAVETGQIPTDVLDARVKKILMAKYWAGLGNYKPVDMAGLGADLNGRKSLELKTALFEQAVTVARNQDNLIPFNHLDTLSFASVAISADYDNEFQKTLSQYANFKNFVVPFKPGSEKDIAWVLDEASKYKVVVVSVHGMNSRGDRNYGVTPATLDFIHQLGKRTHVVVCAFGNPYGLRLYSHTRNLICGYEDDPASHRVVPQILFGALPARGRLPVSIDNDLKVGAGIQTQRLGRVSFGDAESVGMNGQKLDEIAQVVKQGIDNRAFPGCQVLVARKGRIVYNRSFGTLRYGLYEPVTNQTLYDIASMTKVSATLQGVMMLNERGAIDLNEKLSTYLPELKGSNKEKMLISDILLHQAGLVAFMPFWEKTKTGSTYNPEYYSFSKDSLLMPANLQVAGNLYIKPAIRDSVWKWVIDSKLINTQDRQGGYRYTYSDLGLIMMQKLVERITNQPLEEFLEQNLYEPLGMTSTMFNPLLKFPKTIIAPTENESGFRASQIQGTVHDPNAALLGGVSGHAGLFSNASDLVKLFQMNLQNGYYGGRQYLFPETTRHFARNYTQKSHRGLGWDKPGDSDSPIVGSSASPNSYGHSGFTGTVVWVDPDRELIFIFLSNRVYPVSTNNKINTLRIRKRIHEIINESLVLQ
ncbi:glycoside hydrolase family 3 N-terminal domain-containing protein [Emticicia fluvialis]|uniref:glycoside hydrolase family 3 N-terminal domain-containing protein n=1 Tax=Emticicia fluvialis TaxID=2974474 RepID=UPI0021660C90|nr:glycoside hydrolase family 3 N-terminal domain-containing protein [Emticicia fluvialis]